MDMIAPRIRTIEEAKRAEETRQKAVTPYEYCERISALIKEEGINVITFVYYTIDLFDNEGDFAAFYVENCDLSAEENIRFCDKIDNIVMEELTRDDPNLLWCIDPVRFEIINLTE